MLRRCLQVCQKPCALPHFRQAGCLSIAFSIELFVCLCSARLVWAEHNLHKSSPCPKVSQPAAFPEAREAASECAEAVAAAAELTAQGGSPPHARADGDEQRACSDAPDPRAQEAVCLSGLDGRSEGRLQALKAQVREA